jgi:hypothetical protein
MCVACIEFIKGTLNVTEFKSALRETTMEDAAHLIEVERAMSSGSNDAEELRKKLKAQTPKPGSR